MLFYKKNKEVIIIVFDDMNILTANIKLVIKGSSPGHNGIKNIIEAIDPDELMRFKIGFGRTKFNKIKYVLGKSDNKEEYDNGKKE